MAKKPRTQVDYNPGQASLQGGVGASEGNYQVSVAPTPKTNAALQFASFINQVPNVAGQYTNYIEAIGQEKLAMMTEDELIEELAGGDKDTLNILKYNKAYNYGLVEKNFKRNVEAYQKQFDDIAGQIETYPDNDSFIAALDNLDASIGSEFIGQTANDYQKKAGEALLFNTLPTLRAKSLQKYQAFKQDATIQLITGSLHDDMMANTQMNAAEKSNSFLRQFQTELRQFSNLTPSDKSRLYEQFVLNGVARYQARGQENEAVDFLEAAGLFEIYPGARLGSIGDNPAQFERLRQSLLEEEEVSEIKVESLRPRSKSSAESLFLALVQDEFPKEVIESKIKDYYKTAGAFEAQEWVEEKTKETIDALAGLTNPKSRLSIFNRSILGATATTENEKTKDLLNYSAGSFNKARSEFLAPDSLVGADKQEIMDLLAPKINNDPLIELDELDDLETELGKKVKKTSGLFLEVAKELFAQYPYREVKDLKTYYDNLITQSLKEDEFGEYYSSFATQLNGFLSDSELNNRLWNEVDGDKDKFKARLKAEAKNMAKDLERVYLSQLDYESMIEDTEATAANMMNDVDYDSLKVRVNKEAEKNLLGAGVTDKFKSLQTNFDNGKRKIIKEDRAKLVQLLETVKGTDKKKKVTEALSYNLATFGFDTLEDVNIELLTKASQGGVKRLNILNVPIGQKIKTDINIYQNFLENGVLTEKQLKEDIPRIKKLFETNLYSDEDSESYDLIQLLLSNNIKR